MEQKTTPEALAAGNLMRLNDNSYPGRIIIMGMNKARTHLFQFYAIMGRKPESRDRMFVETDDGGIKTEPLDSSKKETIPNADLFFYEAMAEEVDDGFFVYAVSSGAQTQDMLNVYTTMMDFTEFCDKWKHENDPPNFTSRIGGVITLDEGDYELHFMRHKKSPFDDKSDFMCFDSQHIAPGYGLCFHTYQGDDNPLPAFNRDPYVIPVDADILEYYWSILNDEDKVAAALKLIDIKTGESSLEIVNKYSPVSQAVV